MLIFDEVMTGFRVGTGGDQERLDIRPDLTTLGKIVGGGFPVGAYGGRAELMRLVAPEGPVYQAGTLAGNPVTMAAGLATLLETERPGFYETLERRTARLVAGIGDAARRHGVALSAGHAGSMWGAYFTHGPVRNFAEAKCADVRLFARWHCAALERGVYLAPAGCARPQPLAPGAEPELRVGIVAGVGSLALGGDGELFLTDDATGGPIGSIPPSARWTVVADSAGLRLVQPDGSQSGPHRG